MKHFRIPLFSLLMVVALSIAAPSMSIGSPRQASGTVTPSATLQATTQGSPLPATRTPASSPTQAATATPATTATPAPEAASTAAPAQQGAVGELQAALAQVYKKVNPSVVQVWKHIRSSELNTQVPAEPTPSVLPQKGGPQVTGRNPLQYQQPLGSGFVWDQDGHIVTNNHVVQGEARVFVTFSDGRSAPAEVLGGDENTDLAVLAVDMPKEMLQPVTLANSMEAQVGQLVVAIGNPFGYEGTMTSGIVSALGRSLEVAAENAPLNAAPGIIPDIIQTDAPINPGSSGGVLADLDGKVIGVTSDGVPGLRWSAGVGFVIPSVIVARVVPAIIENGTYAPPWLGANASTLMPEIAQAMGLPETQQGALVVDVTVDSPADKAGIRGSGKRVTIAGEDWLAGGDIIVAIDGHPIARSEDIETYLVRNTQPGQTVKLTVIRDGKETTLTMEVGTRPSPEPEEVAPVEPPAGQAWLGVDGATLTPDLATAMKLKPEQQGVLVESVVAGSPADQAELRGGFRKYAVEGGWVALGGDVIVKAEGQPVASLDDLTGILGKMAPGQKLSLTILRDGKELEVSATLATPPKETM